MFWCKIFQTKYDLVVGICDEDLIGKEIKMKKFSVKINKNFYDGKIIDENVAIKIMERATIGNLFGEKIVETAEKNGFITRENIILLNGIPHAQFVKID